MELLYLKRCKFSVLPDVANQVSKFVVTMFTSTEYEPVFSYILTILGIVRFLNLLGITLLNVKFVFTNEVG